MTPVSRILVVLTSTAVLTLSGGTSALTSVGHGSGGDGGVARSPEALTRAAAVALAATGGGRVTGKDVQYGECYYEVKVALDNGEHVDIHLDESLHVLHWYPHETEDGIAGG